MRPRLYCVVDSSLPPGLAAAQAVHAAVEYCSTYRRAARRWRRKSNTVVILKADSAKLHELAELKDSAGCATVKWHEPDLGEQLTAIAGVHYWMPGLESL